MGYVRLVSPSVQKYYKRFPYLFESYIECLHTRVVAIVDVED